MNADQAIDEFFKAEARGDSDPPILPMLYIIQEMLENQRRSVVLLEGILGKLEFAYPDIKWKIDNMVSA